MKFHSVSSSPDPAKIAESERIAAEVAAWEAIHGEIKTAPLRELSHDGRTIQKGRVQMTITKRWNGAAV